MFTKKSFVNYAIITLMSATILGPFVSTAATVRADVAESPSTNATEEVLNNTQVENSNNEKTSEAKAKVDKSKLKIAINDAALANSGIYTYTFESSRELSLAVRDGFTIMDDSSATQDQVDAATKKIYDAINGLVYANNVDKSKLADAHNKAWEKSHKDGWFIKEGKSDYTDASYNRMIDADGEATETFFAADVTQQQVDNATQKLNDAIDKLITKDSVAKLQALIEQGKKLYTTQAPAHFPDGSPWQGLSDAISNGMGTLQELDNMTQSGVDLAINNLNNIINKLSTNNSTNNKVLATTTKTAKETPKTLPQTGEANTQGLTLMGIVGLALTAVLGYIGLNRKKN